MTPPITLDPQLWDALLGAAMQPYGYPSGRWPKAMGGATQQECLELYELVLAADTGLPLQVPDHLRTALANLTTAVIDEVDIDIPAVVFYGDGDPYEVVHRLERTVLAVLEPARLATRMDGEPLPVEVADCLRFLLRGRPDALDSVRLARFRSLEQVLSHRPPDRDHVWFTGTDRRGLRLVMPTYLSVRVGEGEFLWSAGVRRDRALELRDALGFEPQTGPVTDVSVEAFEGLWSCVQALGLAASALRGPPVTRSARECRSALLDAEVIDGGMRVPLHDVGGVLASLPARVLRDRHRLQDADRRIDLSPHLLEAARDALSTGPAASRGRWWRGRH